MTQKVLITGGAGLVGQNLIPVLKRFDYQQITVIDKHSKNVEILRHLHPDVKVICSDLSEPGDWTAEFENVDVVVQLHAQIGGINKSEFESNNVKATQNVLNFVRHYGVKRLVHVSSSVVESSANDWYTETKKLQEELVIASGTSTAVLRPTLMFGWFDRKHLGWLSRFMQKTPIFPIPGDGNVTRQPLYAGDFAKIVATCVNDVNITGVFNISGTEKVTYLEIIQTIKQLVSSRTLIVRIHPKLFRTLLRFWAVFDRNPPFTVQQLDALLANDEFEVIDWPKIFRTEPTSFAEALTETFHHPIYSAIELEF